MWPSISPSHLGWSFIARLSTALTVAAAMAVAIEAQIPGRNVNMVSGQGWPGGDPFLQRQNEPSLAASTRNPLHLLGGANDYRTVDVPGLPDGVETGDAWLGLFKSFDGGSRWVSTLLPGYPQDTSPEGMASPLKGYQAGADAVVRAGTSGIFFYSGLAFDRGDGGKSAIFVSSFIDNNNKEAGDPIQYIGTTLVASAPGTDGRFLDKPWMAVDMPRGDGGRECKVLTQPRVRERRQRPGEAYFTRVPVGTVYVAYSSITGDGDALRSEIYVTSSDNCGREWRKPVRVSRSEDRVNQGASLAIDPATGMLYVAWRRFGVNGGADSILVTRMPPGARRFDPPGVAREFPKGKHEFPPDEVFEHRKRVIEDPVAAREIAQFDQGTSRVSFRSNAYPTMAVDGHGRLYMAWSERGFAQGRSATADGDARIVMTTSMDGRQFTAPRVVDNAAPFGHQLMPTLAFAGGRLMLAYYDVRETRAEVYGPYVSDQGLAVRQTMDIRAAMGTPGEEPQFAPSVKVSDYLMGFRGRTNQIEQLQENPPNLPMFARGTVPFIGDYIDVAPAPAFVPAANGRWAFNTAHTDTPPVFHAVWTDNRDVRPPVDGNWANYTPPTSPATSPTSLFDGSTTAVCQPGNAGSRNQNVYSARITGGLSVGSPGNAKPLSPTLQRGFVVFAQNNTTETHAFRMTILNQPPGGRASFEQFPLPPYTAASPAPLAAIDMRVPARSTASRTVYVTSTNPDAQVAVGVTQIANVGGAPLPGGLDGRVTLNPDIDNPDIDNPDIDNPDIDNPDIDNAEVYNPDIDNPDIDNPDIDNPDIDNPDIDNPDIDNVVVANPDIENVTIGNPDIDNPDIENPDIDNPDIDNPDIDNGTISDVSWTVSNTGNTTAAFNVNLFLSQTTVPSGLATQLILHKHYKTPVTVPNGCDLRYETRNVLITNVVNPTFITPADAGVPDQNNPSESNATMWLGPGESGRITLRVIDPDRSNNVIVINDKGEPVSIDPAFNPETTSVTPGVASQAVPSEDAQGGQTDPPIVTPTGANLFFLQDPVGAIEAADIVPAVRVQARDNTSAVLPGVTVALSLGANPGGATLSGNVAVAGADGIATFPLLQVSAPGVGYTLVATVTSGTVPATGTSSAFDVAAAVVPTQVVNTNDSGPGSLRAALLYANATPGYQTITFNVPGTGPFVIAPVTALPHITEGVVLDGTTQPGYVGQPLVVISGENLPDDTNGLVVAGGTGSTIRGFVVHAFGTASFTGGHAIALLSGNNVVDANYIGTDVSGTGLASSLNYTGVFVASGGNRIGGSSEGTRNVIAGNFQGVWVQSGTGNAIEGNDIGVNRVSGSTIPAFFDQFGNQYGILIDDATNTEIGGAGSRRNLISSNIIGVQLRGGSLTSIVNNYIGVDFAGTTALPNGDGINAFGPVAGTTIGGPTPARNVIAGNIGWGINLDVSADGASTDASIRSNYVGVDAGGNALGNLSGGVRLIEAARAVVGTWADGNVISGNGGPGVYVGGVSLTQPPVIQGNYIGTGPSGLTAAPNTYEGVFLNARAVVGGGFAGAGNLISGNGNEDSGQGAGVLVGPGADGTEVYGNVIGPAQDGTTPLGNGYSGISVYAVSTVQIGGPGGLRNVISGNPQHGIAVYRIGADPLPSNVTIVNNHIGADASGLIAVPNGRWGISILGTGINVGGDVAGYDNLIAFNGTVADADRGGIRVNGVSNEVTIRGNRIHSNEGLGIDLDTVGVTPNDVGDGDTGTNELQNFPALSNATNTMGATTWVDFSTAGFGGGTYTLRFFANTACDASGHGEGGRLVGTMNEISGGGGGTMVLSELVPPGQFVTATATDSDGSTSEFSGCVAVPAAAVITSVNPADAVAAGFGQMLVLHGTGLPGTGADDVLFSQGGPEYAASYTWTAGPSLVIARLPMGVLAAGPATVRVKDAGDTESTAPFAITISTTPGAPLLLKAMSINCVNALGDESPLPGTITAGQPISVLAEGTDSSSAEFLFTHSVSGVVGPVAQSCSFGVTGGVATGLTIPAAFGPGQVTIQMRTVVNGIPSAWSNATSQTIP